MVEDEKKEVCCGQQEAGRGVARRFSVGIVNTRRSLVHFIAHYKYISRLN